MIGEGTTTYGKDLKNLKLDVIYETTDTFHVKIIDSTAQRWEVPQSIVSRPDASTIKELPQSSLAYEFLFSSNPFAFSVTRKSDGASLFKMDKSFVYKDQYLQLSSAINEVYIVHIYSILNQNYKLINPIQTINQSIKLFLFSSSFFFIGRKNLWPGRKHANKHGIEDWYLYHARSRHRGVKHERKSVRLLPLLYSGMSGLV